MSPSPPINAVPLPTAPELRSWKCAEDAPSTACFACLSSAVGLDGGPPHAASAARLIASIMRIGRGVEISCPNETGERG